jgi:hypothetical protein
MTNGTETSGKAVEQGKLSASAHPDYFELFRAFNSEGSFFEFARQLRQEPVQRWQENALAASAG